MLLLVSRRRQSSGLEDVDAESVGRALGKRFGDAALMGVGDEPAWLSCAVAGVLRGKREAGGN